MRRREFVTFIGGAMAWPLIASAQQPVRIPKIGVLWHAGNAEEEAQFRGPLMKGFTDLGYIPGKNVLLEERYANEEADRFQLLAAELVGLAPEVIVAVTVPSALAVKHATSTIPVVFVGPSDPVGMGLIASLARPGGNLTGVSALGLELSAKRVELLKEVLPRVSRISLLYDPLVPNFRFEIPETKRASEQLGLTFTSFDVRNAADFDRIFAEMTRLRVEAVIVGLGPILSRDQRRIADLALAHRLFLVAPYELFVDDGAAMSYGANWPALFRAAAALVDRILKGEKPAEIPVAQPTRFDLVFNLKTARALDIEIPPTMLLRADRVIE